MSVRSNRLSGYIGTFDEGALWIDGATSMSDFRPTKQNVDIGSSLRLTPQTEAFPLALPVHGIPLSQLLAGVNHIISEAYTAGVWTIVEVMGLNIVSRHVYLDLSERDGSGKVLAKVRAVIWGSVAGSILPAFERATGIQLAPGLKLLVRAKPVFKEQYGFSLEIDAIDDQFTLGDFELRKKEIRQKLTAEGIFDANQRLPPPWDYNTVLVVAPAKGAGLGDFQVEAERLAEHGICQFDYCYSRFQGEGAGSEIRAALIDALHVWKAQYGTPPDAIAIIRGGGAANDLAWLNDYHLARLICKLPIPVLTGIGHERDTTLLDEVAHSSFDTPSKVIGGIEHVILRRARDAQAEFDAVMALSGQAMQRASVNIVRMEASVRSDAQRHLANARQLATVVRANIYQQAQQQIADARSDAAAALATVKTASVEAVATARAKTPALLDAVLTGARHGVSTARQNVHSARQAVQEAAQLQARSARERSAQAVAEIQTSARAALQLSGSQAEGLMREIAGQGPEKTLRRGFAIVMANGQPVSRSGQVAAGAPLEIQFSDGALHAHVDAPSV